MASTTPTSWRRCCRGLRSRLERPALDNLAEQFPRPVDAVRLEIGFGGGENLIAEACAHPTLGFIGCEPFVNGMAKILALIEAGAHDNVRLYAGDAIDLLAWLPEGSTAQVDLPIPTRGRSAATGSGDLCRIETVAQLARVLRPGGVFRFATDIAAYAAWTLEHSREVG